MPRLYITPADFQTIFPAALAFAGRVNQLAGIPGALDRLLSSASKRVDGYCKKRLGAIPPTTIATGGSIGNGATSVTLTSTLGYDNGQEQAIILGVGLGTQEILPILPGGVNVTSWTSPYPGTVSLATPTNFAHNAGETVQGCYREVTTVGSSSSSDVYSSALLQLNQAAQIAQAHAPQFDTSGLTRVIFLKNYPIVQLYLLEHMLPIDTTYETLDASQVGIQPSSGYLRLPIGSFVLPEGLFRSTYIGGYQSVPEEVQRATALYAMDEIQTMLSMGAYDLSQGKLRGTYASQGGHFGRFVYEAEQILSDGGYVRLT